MLKWKNLPLHSLSAYDHRTAGDALNSILKSKTPQNIGGDAVLKGTFTYGVTLLAQKLADKAGEKIETLFRKK